MKKFIVAVDFDGTLVENAFPNIGKEISGAFSALKQMKKEGIILILWTCRSGKFLDDAIKFCKDKGIEFDSINENYKGLSFTTSQKIYADMYIDDRAFPKCVSLKKHMKGGENYVYQVWKR